MTAQDIIARVHAPGPTGEVGADTAQRIVAALEADGFDLGDKVVTKPHKPEAKAVAMAHLNGSDEVVTKPHKAVRHK